MIERQPLCFSLSYLFFLSPLLLTTISLPFHDMERFSYLFFGCDFGWALAFRDSKFQSHCCIFCFAFAVRLICFTSCLSMGFLSLRGPVFVSFKSLMVRGGHDRVASDLYFMHETGISIYLAFLTMLLCSSRELWVGFNAVAVIFQRFSLGYAVFYLLGPGIIYGARRCLSRAWHIS